MRLCPLILTTITMAVSACDPGTSELTSTCSESFIETTCIELGADDPNVSLEFESLLAGNYCAAFRQTQTKPNRVTSAQLTLNETTELMGPSDFSQKVLSVAKVFHVDAGVHHLSFEKTATKNGTGQLCLYSDSTCRPIEDIEDPESYDEIATLAVNQLSLEGLLELSDDPWELVVDRMATLMNVCPDDLLANTTDGDIFRHYSEDFHWPCLPISPHGQYWEGAQYCGIGSCMPNSITFPFYLHYVNKCINEFCQSHDVCYDEIQPGSMCYWTDYTFGCDLTLATSVQFCSVPKDEENDTKAERIEKTHSRWAKAGIAALTAYSATNECCSLTPPTQIGSECAVEPLEGEPDVHYCISFSADDAGDQIVMTMTRSDGTSFGNWYVGVDLELEVDGKSKILRGDCALHEGNISLTQHFGSPTIGANKTATGVAHVRVAPDHESCKSQPSVAVSSASLTCDKSD